MVFLVLEVNLNAVKSSILPTKVSCGASSCKYAGFFETQLLLRASEVLKPEISWWFCILSGNGYFCH